MLAIFGNCDWFFIKLYAIGITLSILIFVSTQLHANLLVAWSHVEADDILFKEVSCLLFNELVKMILLYFWPQAHDSVCHGDFLIGYFDILQIEGDGVRIFRVLEEKDFQEEAFPSLECIPFQTPYVHHCLFGSLLCVSFLVRKSRRGD